MSEHNTLTRHLRDVYGHLHHHSGRRGSGIIANTGTASGTPPTGSPVTASASVTIQANQSPAIVLAKQASILSFSAAGVPVTYTYTVTNPGNVTLHSVTVTDPMPGLSAITCPNTTLAPGAPAIICTATYTTTQADIDRGSINNTGTAAGISPTGAGVQDTSAVTIPGAQDPAITLVKSVDASTFSTAGTLLVYSYLVTNTGNVTLSSIGVTDPMPGLSTISCPFTALETLLPGGSETCTATYTITQANVDAGQITNTGTATGTPPSGPPVTDSSSVTLPLSQAPAIALSKSASITIFSAPGILITYSYLVTNTGNQTLHSITVDDPQSGLSAITCPTGSLAPGGSETCTATYTTTQADVDNGSITNTGNATGTPPSGPPVTDQASVIIPALQSPGMTMVKSADPATFSAPGTVITYSYLVTNTGNVTLTAINVSDPLPNLSPVTCLITPLAPGGSETCTATYTTTQADVDNGSITNTAIASGLPPTGPPPTTTPSSVTIPATQDPHLEIAKAANPNRFSSAGTPITFSYILTNDGNVTLTGVTVTDPLQGLSPISCPNSTLAPGGLMTCMATYTTTQADMDAGGVTNTGTGTGNPPSGPPVTDAMTITTPAISNPSITLDKSASVTTYAAAGSPVTYSYEVTNTGNVTLSPVTVTDPMSGLSALVCPDTSLAPAGSETCTATYTTTQADMDTGTITNTGTATGDPPTGPAVTATSSVTLTAVPAPAINLTKSASITSFAAAGTPVTYSYQVTNTGNVTLNPVTVTDPMNGLSPITCPLTPLAPTTSETCTATYTTTQTDVDVGSISNTGTATGISPTGTQVTDTSTVTISAVQAPGIGIVKSANPTTFAAAGVLITYSYVVTNSGNATLRCRRRDRPHDRAVDGHLP